MANDLKSEVNYVESVISDKAELLDSTCSIVGPIPIDLPLPGDATKLAFTLEQVLSPIECGRLIQAAEALGFRAAGLGTQGDQIVATQFRDSGRVIIEDLLLSRQLFERIRPYLPTVWDGRRIVGLNEQLKFLRYTPGQKFVAHFDGSFCRPNTVNKTCLTVQLYLSRKRTVGGATRFMGANGVPPVCCSPDMGRALVFQHNILHDGEEVKEGIKYTIRTDVEYSGRTWHAQLQTGLGFGCSPIKQRRRFSVAVAIFVALSGVILTRFS